MQSIKPENAIQQRFSSLRGIARVLEVFGVLALVICEIIGIFLITHDPNNENLVPAIRLIVGGVMAFIFYFLLAELIRLGLGIEENTRATYLWVKYGFETPKPDSQSK